VKLVVLERNGAPNTRQELVPVSTLVHYPRDYVPPRNMTTKQVKLHKESKYEFVGILRYVDHDVLDAVRSIEYVYHDVTDVNKFP
jgi:hypothetical protein